MCFITCGVQYTVVHILHCCTTCMISFSPQNVSSGLVLEFECSSHGHLKYLFARRTYLNCDLNNKICVYFGLSIVSNPGQNLPPVARAMLLIL